MEHMSWVSLVNVTAVKAPLLKSARVNQYCEIIKEQLMYM